MIQIKYVNTTQQLSHILAKGSLTRDRWTQLALLVNIMSHTRYAQSNLSVSSANVNPLFSIMSKRTGECFAASASAKQKPVRCTAMTVRKPNSNNADMDRHAALPSNHEAGGHCKREELSASPPNNSPTRRLEHHQAPNDWMRLDRYQAQGDRKPEEIR